MVYMGKISRWFDSRKIPRFDETALLLTPDDGWMRFAQLHPRILQQLLSERCCNP
jgi:hypothetical protein